MDTTLEPIELAVATQLRMELARHNVTQSHVAKETGISLRAVNRYINGERSIKITVLKKICDAIGVSATSVLQAAEYSLQ